MGAKTCMLAFSNGDLPRELAALPAPDRAGSVAFAAALFPKDKLELLADSTLSNTYIAEDEVLVSRFGTAGIAIAHDFALDRPSQLPPSFLRATVDAQTVCVHAMHSVVDWFAFAVWKNGVLVRSLSVAPDSGILEDIGDRLPFEMPFWAGEHSADDPEDLEAGEEPYPIPFHPLELGEVALREFFGFTIEGVMDADQLNPEAIALLRFKRKKRSLLSFWK
ncbi:DUF6928 family protein [Roseateles sp.]|uniref:DUF6928 family protein n=1 Tax=Roseateles sp. TaxID=1971397 RepID=UPI003BA93C89